VRDLRVELDTEDLPVAARKRGISRIKRVRYRDKTFGQDRNVVSMAHPRGDVAGHAVKKIIVVVDEKLGPAKLSLPRALYAAAEKLSYQLLAVTNTEYRDAELKDELVALRGLVIIYAGRPSGKNKPFGGYLLYLLNADIMRNDGAVNLIFTYAAGYKLRIL